MGCGQNCNCGNSMWRRRDLIVKNLFHAEVVRFLREGWVVDYVNWESLTVVHEKRANFSCTWLEISVMSWTSYNDNFFAQANKGRPQQRHDEERESLKVAVTTKHLTDPKATPRKTFSSAYEPQPKFPVRNLQKSPLRLLHPFQLQLLQHHCGFHLLLIPTRLRGIVSNGILQHLRISCTKRYVTRRRYLEKNMTKRLHV